MWYLVSRYAKQLDASTTFLFWNGKRKGIFIYKNVELKTAYKNSRIPSFCHHPIPSVIPPTCFRCLGLQRNEIISWQKNGKMASYTASFSTPYALSDKCLVYSLNDLIYFLFPATALIRSLYVLGAPGAASPFDFC